MQILFPQKTKYEYHKKQTQVAKTSMRSSGVENTSALLNKKALGIAFGGSYEENFQLARVLLKKFVAQNVKSPSYDQNLGFKKVFFENEMQKDKYVFDLILNKKILGEIRDFMNKTKFASLQEMLDTLEQIVFKQKIANCGEMSVITNNWFNKNGVNSFKGFMAGTSYSRINGMNHTAVFVSEKPINNDQIRVQELLDRKDVFVFDPWLKSIFSSMKTALKVYAKLFDLKPNDKISNVSKRLKTVYTSKSKYADNAKVILAEKNALFKRIEEMIYQNGKDYDEFSRIKYLCKLYPDIKI